MEDEKSQVATLKREIQSLSETCDDVEQKRQKLAAELHTKETHINAINGQMAHLKKSLDQETSKVIIVLCCNIRGMYTLSREKTVKIVFVLF